MRLLLVTTKPPWPPIGGGNVAVHHLLQGLRESGVDTHIISLESPSHHTDTRAAPYPLATIDGRPRPWWRVAHHAVLPPPMSLARFHSSHIKSQLLTLAASIAPDLIHLEQLHLAWTGTNLARVAPVVLRQQNVESVILARLARLSRGGKRWLLQREARRMATAEAHACSTLDSVAAISAVDAERLRQLAPRADIHTVPVCFAPTCIAQDRPCLAGDPPLICLGSFDWLPSRDGGLWLTRAIWPQLRRRLPKAVLHLAGPGSDTLVDTSDPWIRSHGVVDDPTTLLDPRGIILVPVRAGSGVRLRILEAWGAGIPVVTTTVGAEGLAETHGDGVAIADSPAAFAQTVEQVSHDAAFRDRLTHRGHTLLQRYHPQVVTAQFLHWYESVLKRSARP